MADQPVEPVLEEELEEQGGPSGDEPQAPEQVEDKEEPDDQGQVSEGESNDEPEGDSEEEPDKPEPSRREQLRIQQLLEKYGQPGDQKPTLPEIPGMDYEAELNADPETLKRLQDDRQAAIQAMWEAGQEQNKSILFHNRLEIDAPRVEQKYPILDKNSDKFNTNFASALNTWYLNMVGYNPQTDTVSNPNIRYSDFAEGFMEMVQEGAKEVSENTRKNVTKQVAQTGLRPDGSASKSLNLNKAPQDMTDEELKAAIAASMPKK